MTKLHTLLLNQLPHGYRRSNLTGKIPLPINGLKLTGQDNGHHTIDPPCEWRELVGYPIARIDSIPFCVDNGDSMQSLDVQHPGMPDLQFVLFVTALCTANLTTINVPEDLRRQIFDRCWSLVHTDAPPTNPVERVLDLRGGTELTLEACTSTIRSLLIEAEIHTLVWDHPVSEPTRESTPEARPLIDRLGRLYPSDTGTVDQQNESGH